MLPFFRKKKLSMDDLFTSIENADYDELNQIIDAVTWRYQCLFPDYDISFLSLPKDLEKRRIQLDQMMLQLRNGNLK